MRGISYYLAWGIGVYFVPTLWGVSPVFNLPADLTVICLAIVYICFYFSRTLTSFDRID